MLKHLTFTVIATLFSIASATAKEPQKGYRGFLDVDFNIGHYSYFDDSKITECFLGGATSHGYQFNKNLFVGAGLMIEKSFKYNHWTLPLFVQVRTDRKWGEYTPFGDLRIGYNCCDGGGIYLSPTIGYRFAMSNKLNLNVGMGMTLRGYTSDHYNAIFETDPVSGNTHLIVNYAGKKHHTNAMYTVRVGIDF